MLVIKRYANRKLYDTESRRYVTLEDLANIIRQGEDLKVVDHVTGEDLTSVTLLQVIFEEEKKIGGLLPQVFLSRLIRAGGETVSALRSRLISMAPFQVVDEEIRRRVQDLVDQNRLSEEEGRRIVDLLVRKPAEAVRIPVQAEGEAYAESSSSEPPAPEPVDLATVEALKRQVDLLEQELERLVHARQSAQPRPPDLTAAM